MIIMPKGNPFGNLDGLGHYRNNIEKEWQSKKGHYKVAQVESFEGVTERDVELRREYAKDLIGMHTNSAADFIQLRRKESNVTLSSLHEVYYVKIGHNTVGKISISVQRVFNKINLSFIFQEKRVRDSAGQGKNKQMNPEGVSKATKRKQNRKTKHRKNKKY